MSQYDQVFRENEWAWLRLRNCQEAASWQALREYPQLQKAMILVRGRSKEHHELRPLAGALTKCSEYLDGLIIGTPKQGNIGNIRQMCHPGVRLASGSMDTPGHSTMSPPSPSFSLTLTNPLRGGQFTWPWSRSSYLKRKQEIFLGPNGLLAVHKRKSSPNSQLAKKI